MESALSLNGKEFSGSALIVERKTKSKEKSAADGNASGTSHAKAAGSGFDVFVGGLYSISKKNILKHFAACGEVESFEMPLTSKGESKGIAFIAYKTQEAMLAALELNNTQFCKRRLAVERRQFKTERPPAEDKVANKATTERTNSRRGF